jgi:hypothetical protein
MSIEETYPGPDARAHERVRTDCGLASGLVSPLRHRSPTATRGAKFQVTALVCSWGSLAESESNSAVPVELQVVTSRVLRDAILNGWLRARRDIWASSFAPVDGSVRARL